MKPDYLIYFASLSTVVGAALISTSGVCKLGVVIAACTGLHVASPTISAGAGQAACHRQPFHLFD